MLLSLNWLKEYVNIPKSLSAEELAEKMTLHTVEVEGIEKEGEKFKGIVVGEILEVKKHGNATHLQIAEVNIGKTKLTIVCGAPNIAPGQLVPVATVGTIMPGGMEIKEAEIRGEKSFGMLCAEDELGLGTDHSGIMILEKAKIGQSLAEYLKLDDIILEVDNKSLSNRPDLFSHYGIAREISAFLDVKLNELKLKKIKADHGDKHAKLEKLDVKIEDKNLCPRYMAVKINGVKIADSPAWLQKKLISVGAKPINNIVDITNYVMLSIGQPLHAFNADVADKIIVRPAKNEELIDCLDNKERKLNNSNLVIANGEKAMAIAGMIGGKFSSVTAETENIIIEAATFNAYSVRKSSGALTLRTDASVRFEKALDVNLAEDGLMLAIELILEICPEAKIASEITDIKQDAPEIKEITFDLNWLEKLSGNKIEKKKATEILSKLGFIINADPESDNILNIIIPSWRATKDIKIKEDLAEEIMRIIGYDDFPIQVPFIKMAPAETNRDRMIERKIKDILSKENALSEVYNYSFVGEDDLKKINMDFSTYIKLANPISKQHTLMRQNLSLGLINNIKTNQYKYDDLALFEVGTIFLNVPGEFKKHNSSEETLPHQEKMVSIALAGNNDQLFSQGKSIVTNFLMSLTDLSVDVAFLPTDLIIGYADATEKAVINVNGKNIGTIAKIDANIGKSFGLKKDAVIIEMDFKDLLLLSFLENNKKYNDIPKFPPMVRDLAFVIDQKILYNDIRNEIKNFHELIKSVDLFDVYVGKNLGEDKKNLAFHIIYQSNDRTLTTEEIDEIQKNLIENLEKRFEAQIRNF